MLFSTEMVKEQEYNLLVVDDDPMIHALMRGLLGKEYNLIHAGDVQEAVDALAENIIHFILSDIHMEGMTGIEFLESLTKDTEKRDIPFLIMTSLPSVAKEQKALDLGAADFIDKARLYKDKEEVVQRIRMKLVGNVDVRDMPEELKLSRKRINRKMMFEVANHDFLSSAQALIREVLHQLQLDHISFWKMMDKQVHMVIAHGLKPPASYGPEDFMREKHYEDLIETRRPYVSNHVFNDDDYGVLTDFSVNQELPAEIGVPLFQLTEKELIKNKMKIPSDADLFGYIFLKRKKMFSTKEYRLVSVLLMQVGTILWRLYSEM